MGYIKEIYILVTDNVVVVSFYLTIVNFYMGRMVAIYIVIRFKNIKIRFKIGYIVTKLLLKLTKIFVVVFKQVDCPRGSSET